MQRSTTVRASLVPLSGTLDVGVQETFGAVAAASPVAGLDLISGTFVATVWKLNIHLRARITVITPLLVYLKPWGLFRVSTCNLSARQKKTGPRDRCLQYVSDQMLPLTIVRTVFLLPNAVIL